MTESDNPQAESDLETSNQGAGSPDAQVAAEAQTSAAVEPNVDGPETIDLAGDGKDELTVLKEQLAAAEQKVIESEKQVLMAQADMENHRKRNQRNTEERIRYAALPMMNELLEAVDNLERALSTAKQEENTNQGLVEGVGMVAQQIASVLESYGCKKIEAVGQTFDPNLHQAIQMQPSADFEANIVMQEMRAGFQLHDRVIRPSQVFVSTGPAQESTGDDA